MMPQSWTMRGALLLLAVATAIIVAGYRGAPEEVPIAIDALPLIEARSAYMAQWMSSAAELLLGVAGVLGTYGLRNLPTNNRAPTSAEIQARPALGPTE